MDKPHHWTRTTAAVMGACVTIIVALYLLLIVAPTWSSGLYKRTDQEIRSGQYRLPPYSNLRWRSPLMAVIIAVSVAEALLLPLLGLGLLVLLAIGRSKFTVFEQIAWLALVAVAAVVRFGTTEYFRAFSTWLID